MAADGAMNDSEMHMAKRQREDPSEEASSGEARGVGLQQSPGVGAQDPPPAQLDPSEEASSGEAGLQQSPGVGSQDPPPATPRTQSRWNEWLQNSAAGKFEYHEGERIFEFSDSFSRTGWKPYDQLAQGQLYFIFTDMTGGSSTLKPINCLGWDYSVKFDLFHRDGTAFVNAPKDTIGYQVALHEMTQGTKRWIRLTTYPGA